jgi:protein TonB
VSTLPPPPKTKATLSPAAWVLSAAVHFGFLGTAMVVIMGPGVPHRDKPLPPLIIHPSNAKPVEMVFDEPIVDPPQREMVPVEIPDLPPPLEEPIPQLPKIERPHWVVKAEPIPDTAVPPDTLLVRILPAAAPAPAPAESAAVPEPVAETFSEPAPSQPIRIAYPAYARRRGMEGVVEVEIAVDETGAVTSLKVVRSSGHPLLDKAALRGLADVRFAPARRNGVAVPHTFRQPVRFVLK